MLGIWSGGERNQTWDPGQIIWHSSVFTWKNVYHPEPVSAPSESGLNFTCMEVSFEYISYPREIKLSPCPFYSLKHSQTGLYLFVLKHSLVHTNLCIFLSSIHVIHLCWNAVSEGSTVSPEHVGQNTLPCFTPFLSSTSLTLNICTNRQNELICFRETVI